MKTYVIVTTFLSFFVLGNSFAQQDSIERNQRAYYECSDVLSLESTAISVQQDSIYLEFVDEEFRKDLDSLGFRWGEYTPDEYLMAYLINTTDSLVFARRQDGSLMMIQEALNEKGEWEPIEFWIYSGCGNSYFNPLKLESQTYSIVPVKRYSGDFKTKIRLKWKNGATIRYSSTIDASINPMQFNKPKGNVSGVLYRGPASYFDDENKRF